MNVLLAVSLLEDAALPELDHVPEYEAHKPGGEPVFVNVRHFFGALLAWASGLLDEAADEAGLMEAVRQGNRLLGAGLLPDGIDEQWLLRETEQLVFTRGHPIGRVRR